MNIADVAEMYWGAMGCDSRLKKLDDRQLLIWAKVLQDVPGKEAVGLVEKLYAHPRMVPLQPGDVAQAWAEVREDRAAAARELLEDCPSHPGQKLPHCRSCRADALVSGRARPVVRTSKAVDRPSQSAGAFFVPKEVD